VFLSIDTGLRSDVLESYTQEAQKTDGAPEQMRRLEEVVVKIEELNAEVGVYLGILYFVVEVCRGDEEFGEELSRLTTARSKIG
jgi:hypothetical protein